MSGLVTTKAHQACQLHCLWCSPKTSVSVSSSSPRQGCSCINRGRIHPVLLLASDIVRGTCTQDGFALSLTAAQKICFPSLCVYHPMIDGGARRASMVPKRCLLPARVTESWGRGFCPFFSTVPWRRGFSFSRMLFLTFPLLPPISTAKSVVLAATPGCCQILCSLLLTASSVAEMLPGQAGAAHPSTADLACSLAALLLTAALPAL